MINELSINDNIFILNLLMLLLYIFIGLFIYLIFLSVNRLAWIILNI